MKTMYTNSGEKVTLTGITRGDQVEVIYSDGSDGWEHLSDLLD